MPATPEDVTSAVTARLVPVAAPMTGVTMTMPVLVHALMTPDATVPNTGATITMLVLVQALITPDATVPSAGVTKAGLVNVPVLTAGFVIIGVVKVGVVANTNRPVPVSSVIAARRLALEGTAKNACIFVP